MDKVRLCLPLGSKYVMIARLTASGYCVRAGMDIEKTEDVKVIISEVLNKCIVYTGGNSGDIDVEFSTDDRQLTVAFGLGGIKKAVETGNDDDFGISIISALCGEMGFDGDDILILKFTL